MCSLNKQNQRKPTEPSLDILMICEIVLDSRAKNLEKIYKNGQDSLTTRTRLQTGYLLRVEAESAPSLWP